MIKKKSTPKTKAKKAIEAVKPEGVSTGALRFGWLWYSIIAILLAASVYGFIQHRNDTQLPKAMYTENGYLVLPDLDAKIKETEAMKDWRFVLDPDEEGSVYLQVPDYTTIAKKCLDSDAEFIASGSNPDIAQAVGRVSVYEGTFDAKTADDVLPEDVLKQFDDFYLVVSDFQGLPCYESQQET